MGGGDTLFNIVFAVTVVANFSGIGVLIYLAIMKFGMPNLEGSGFISYLFQFIFSVTSGVATYFFTDLIFGHGTDNATATGITTALIIGVATNMLGGSSNG